MSRRSKRKAARRAGRPRTLNAKRRETTVAGRTPETDPGTAELRRHRIAATTSAELPNDLFGILLGRQWISTVEYRTSCEFADLVRTVHRSLGLTEASPAGTWRNILAASQVNGVTFTNSNAAERARRALVRFQRDLEEYPWRAISDAVDNIWWPETQRFIAELRTALGYLEKHLPLR
jgi:hypothetical protein